MLYCGPLTLPSDGQSGDPHWEKYEYNRWTSRSPKKSLSSLLMEKKYNLPYIYSYTYTSILILVSGMYILLIETSH